MKVLSLDTTSEFLDMSLVDGTKAWSRRIKAVGNQDEKLQDVLNHLLGKSRMRLKDMDLFVAASGPGSFTGIRVGMTFISILAHTLEKPAVAVSLLEAQAFARADTGAKTVGVVLPSRRDEFFFQVFRAGVSSSIPAGTPRLLPRQCRAGVTWNPTHSPRWISPQDWPGVFREDAGHSKIVLIGPAAQVVFRLLPPKLAKQARVQLSYPTGSRDLVFPAIIRHQNGHASDFSPLYLRPPYYDRAPALENDIRGQLYL